MHPKRLSADRSVSAGPSTLMRSAPIAHKPPAVGKREGRAAVEDSLVAPLRGEAHVPVESQGDAQRPRLHGPGWAG